MSAFNFAATSLTRRHGPRGYVDYQSYKPWLRDEFTFRCAYCLVRERYYPHGHRTFGVDHMVPQSDDVDRICDYDNLAYACEWCNSIRQNVPLVLDPFSDGFAQHLQINEDGSVQPLTREGKAHIDLFRLDDPQLTRFRAYILETLRILQESTDPGAAAKLLYLIGYPDDLPDLRSLRPTGNSRPDGVLTSCYVRREQGTLPLTY